jgi:hypothetical protein
MRNTFFICATVILLLLAFSSCKKDSKKEDILKTNSFTIDGTNYDLAQGYIMGYGGYYSRNYYEMILYSGGLTLHEKMGEPDTMSGTGHYVYLEIYSSGTDNIATGTYTYNNTNQAGSFNYAVYIVNWNTELTSHPANREFASGNLRIIRNNPEYELSFTGKDENYKSISVYYKGRLKYYDFSGQIKTK